MEDVVHRSRLARGATLLLLTLACMVGAAGWLAIGETPAAPRVVEAIKPYDPLP